MQDRVVTLVFYQQLLNIIYNWLTYYLSFSKFQLDFLRKL